MDAKPPDAEPDPELAGDDGDDDALALGAQPDAIDEDGDDATPVCLRCFAPLVGAPTRCPSCGAPASRAALLGPSAGGGVDAGGRTVETLGKTYDGRYSPWSIVIVWGLGMILFPYVGLVALGSVAAAGAPGDVLWIAPVGVFVVWTVGCVWYFVRARARARAAHEATKTF